MEKVTEVPKSNQPLPAAQDVIATNLLGWTGGRLPILELEQAAAELFADEHPRILWAALDCEPERDKCRRQIVRAYMRFLQMQRWTLGTAAERLADELCQVLFGDARTNTNARREVQDFAESVIEDAAKWFTGDRSESWKYVPEDEPDDSELEVIKPGVQ